MFSKLIIGVLLAVLATGCVAPILATGPAFNEGIHASDNDAVVYIYRPYDPRNPAASRVWPDIYFNGRKVVELKLGGYTAVKVKPGTYHVSAEKHGTFSTAWNAVETIQVAPKETYYLAFETTAKFGTNVYVIGSTVAATNEARSFTSKWTLQDGGPIPNELKNSHYIEPIVSEM